MKKPRIVDLFCGAGGAAMGLHRAGFDVVGFDNKPQPNYPFEFVMADWTDAPVEEFDGVWASPPCQRYSTATDPRCKADNPDLVPDVQAVLRYRARSYVIENVPGSPLRTTLTLCGLSFGLRLLRHRHFETSFICLAPAHKSHAGLDWRKGDFVTVCSGGGFNGLHEARKAGPDADPREVAAAYRRERNPWQRKANYEEAMGIDWMTRYEITQAVPPAYAEWIGLQWRAFLEGGRAAKEMGGGMVLGVPSDRPG